MAKNIKYDVSLGKRIQQLRNDRSLSQKALAASGIGISLPTIQRYEAGELPGAKGLDKIVNYYKCSKLWLLTGEGVPYPGESRGVCEAMPGYHDSCEFVLINQINGSISAGSGLMPDNSVDMRLAFRRDWFKRRGRPENMTLIKVSGDSMSPSLLVGDIVMVDHSRTSIQVEGGIYAISINNEIMIKRLQLQYQNQKILVISDNKQYPSQEIDADKITINGKVIWYARELEK
jgi:phage repressor protein C with HTH and peptisase S24 domain